MSAKPLTQKQKICALELARGATLAQVSRTVGVAENTIRNWRNLPEFAGKVKEEEEKYLDHLRQRSMRAQETALNALEDGLKLALQGQDLKAIALLAGKLISPQSIHKATGLDGPEPDANVHHHHVGNEMSDETLAVYEKWLDRKPE